MVTTLDRDPRAVAEAMASVAAAAIEEGTEPVRWELGFFILRDLVGVRTPNFRYQPWQRLESAWGAEIHVAALEDVIRLIAARPETGEIIVFHAKGY